MQAWNLKEAQDHFSELVHFSHKEPQLIYEQGQLLSVVLDYQFFQQLLNTKTSDSAPSINELLAEIRVISQEEGELDILPRQDRSNSMIEI